MTIDLEPPEDVDPEAPYGRNAKGVPYKRPKEWRDKTTAALQNGAATAARMTASGTRSSSTRKQPAGTTDYRAAVAGLLSIPAMALTMLGRVNPVFALDGLAIKVHTPGIAAAINDAAMTNDQLAQALDKILSVGPYGALFAAMIPLATQIAANHGLVEVSPDAGTLAPVDLMRAAGLSVTQPTQETPDA